MTDLVFEAIADVRAELERALERFPPLNSPHEGYAVILEELEELWEHVRANTGRTAAAYKEAIQTAAMALRYAAELAAHPSVDEWPDISKAEIRG